MTCEEAGPFLPELSDGSLGDAERREVQAHLDGCAKCRVTRDRLSRVAGLLAPAARVPDPGEAFWQAQRSRILTRGAGAPVVPMTAFRRSLRRFGLAAAAAFLVAAG